MSACQHVSRRTRKILTDKSCVKTGMRENFCGLGRENFFPSLETIFSTCGKYFAFLLRITRCRKYFTSDVDVDFRVAYYEVVPLILSRQFLLGRVMMFDLDYGSPSTALRLTAHEIMA